MENLILRNNIIGISIFSFFLLFIFIFPESFICQYKDLHRQFCPIRIDSLSGIRLYIGIILIHIVIIFTRLSPFYRRINSEKSSAILLIVLSIVSAIFLHILFRIQINDHDGGGPFGLMSWFYIIIIPFSLFSFVLYTIVYSILTRNLYFILFYCIIGGLYYLTYSTENEIIGILGFGIVLVGMYYFIFHLLWYLFDNRNFIENNLHAHSTPLSIREYPPFCLRYSRKVLEEWIRITGVLSGGDKGSREDGGGVGETNLTSMKSGKNILIGIVVFGAIAIVGNILINFFIDQYTGRIAYRSLYGEKVYLTKGVDGIYRDRYGNIIRNPTYCGLRGEKFRVGIDGIYDWVDWENKEAGCIRYHKPYSPYQEDEWGTYFREYYGDPGYNRIGTGMGGTKFTQLPNQPGYDINGYILRNKFYLYGKELIGVKNINELRFLVFSKSQNIFFLTDGRSVWMHNWEGLKLLGQYNEGKFTEKDGVFTDGNNCYFTGNGNQMVACNPSKISYVGVDKYKYKPDNNGFIKTESGIIDSKNDTAFSDGLHEYDYYGRFLR